MSVMSSLPWRNTFRPPVIVAVDARLSFFILIALIHMSKLTAGLCASITLILWFVEKRKNLSVESSLRWIRCEVCNLLFGKRRLSTFPAKALRFYDATLPPPE